MKSPSLRFHRRKIILVLSFLLCIGVVWFFMPNSALPPEATILPADHSIRSQELPRPDRWIPPTWGWLWRLRYALLGKPAVIQIKGEFVRLLPASDARLVDALSGHEPLVATNGIRAWILQNRELRAFRRRLGELEGYKVMASPQITSGHGVQANLTQTTTATIGSTQVSAGIFFNCLTCARDKTTVLTAAMTHSEAVTNLTTTVAVPVLGNATRIHTNLTLAAKMQIPPGYGVFLLDTNHADPLGRHVGIFISSKVQ